MNQQNRVPHITGCRDVHIILSSIFQRASKLVFTLSFTLNWLCFSLLHSSGIECLEQPKEQGNETIPFYQAIVGAPQVLLSCLSPALNSSRPRCSCTSSMWMQKLHSSTCLSYSPYSQAQQEQETDRDNFSKVHVKAQCLGVINELCKSQVRTPMFEGDPQCAVFVLVWKTVNKANWLCKAFILEKHAQRQIYILIYFGLV